MSDNAVKTTPRTTNGAPPPHQPESTKPATQPTDPPSPGKLSRGSRWAVLLILAALLGHVADSGWSYVTGFFGHSSPPPIATQLNEVVSRAARDGFRLIGPPRKVRFRAAGPASWMLHFRPLDVTSKSSDELRVYDVVDRKLKLGFDFRPEILGKEATTSPAIPPQAPIKLPQAFAISVRQVRNLDGAPGDEVVIDLTEFSVTPLWPRPAIIFWNAATQSFEIEPFLSPHTTHLASMRTVITRQRLTRSDTYTRALMTDVYEHPVTIVDATGKTPPFATYAVETYILRRESLKDPRGQTSGGLAMTAGYIVKSSGFGTPDLLQAVTWHIDLRRDPLTARGNGRPPIVLKVGANFSRLAYVLQRGTSGR
jgi:hypothetical protein